MRRILLLVLICCYWLPSMESYAQNRNATDKKIIDELKKDEEFKKVYDELERTKKLLLEAKKEAETFKKQISDVGKTVRDMKDGDSKDLKRKLSPDKILMGLFPNTDGFLDGKFDLNKNYFNYLNTGFAVTFSTVNDEVTESDKYKSSSVKKDLTAHAQLIGFQVPLKISDSGLLGIKFAVGSMYTYDKISTSGFKVDQSDTIYFDTKKNVHNISPSADAGINMVLGQFFSFHVSGGYLPFVYINESGEKKYSSYEHPIKYSFRNVNKGYHIDGALVITDLPIGDIELFGSMYDYGGEYQTDQVLITGAYLTKIKTYSTYTRRTIDLGVNYTLTFLGGFSKYIPILSCGYTSNYEKLGDSVLFNQGVYHFGMMIKVN